METTHFSIIKQKIIKTNDLLQLFEEQKCKLLSTTKLYKDVKMKYENVLAEKKRLAMENERITFVLNNLKPKHDQCTSELEILQAEHGKLVERYEKTLIESQLNYKQLEDGLVNCTCNKTSKKKQTIDVKKQSIVVKKQERVKELTEKCDQYKQTEVEVRRVNAALILKSNQLSSELENLKRKHQDEVKSLTFKSSILQSEVDTLKGKVESLNQKLKDSNSVSFELISLEDEKDFEVSRLQRKVRKLSREREALETLSRETQTSTIALVDHSVQTDKILRIRAVNIAIQTDESVATDEFYSVTDIFGEMTLPDLLSPLSPFSVCGDEEDMPSQQPDDVSDNQSKIPDIIVTPPTPIVEKAPLDIFEPPPRLAENKRVSNARMEQARASKEVMRMHRHTYKRKLLLQRKRHPVIKERPSSQDDIVKVLKSLKANDINFTITNGWQDQCRQCVCPPVNITNEHITCLSKGCIEDHHYMVLNNRHGTEPELLGFFNVKREQGMKSLGYGIDDVKPQPQFDLKYLVNGLLEGIRELVVEKRKRVYKKPKRKRSDFNSATESELEKLFAEPNILFRNKMLLRAAKEQKFNTETDSEYMVDSGLVTGTPNMDESSLSCDNFSLQNSLSPFKLSTCPTMLSPLTSEKDYACSKGIAKSIENDHQYANKCEDAVPSHRYFLRNKRKSSAIEERGDKPVSGRARSKKSKSEAAARLSFENLFEQPICGLNSTYDPISNHVSSEEVASNVQEVDVTSITDTIIESYKCVPALNNDMTENRKSVSGVVDVVGKIASGEQGSLITKEIVCEWTEPKPIAVLPISSDTFVFEAQPHNDVEVDGGADDGNGIGLKFINKEIISESSSKELQVSNLSTGTSFQKDILTEIQALPTTAKIRPNRTRNVQVDAQTKFVTKDSLSEILPSPKLNCPTPGSKQMTDDIRLPNRTLPIADKNRANENRNENGHYKVKFISKEFVSGWSSEEDISAGHRGRSSVSAELPVSNLSAGTGFQKDNQQVNQALPTTDEIGPNRTRDVQVDSKTKLVNKDSSSEELPAPKLRCPTRDSKEMTDDIRLTNQTLPIADKNRSNENRNENGHYKVKFISKEFVSDSSSEEDISAGHRGRSSVSADESPQKEMVVDRITLTEVKEENPVEADSGGKGLSEKDLFGEDISSNDEDLEEDLSARKYTKLCKKKQLTRNKLQRTIASQARAIRSIYKSLNGCDTVDNKNNKGCGKKISIVQNIVIKKGGKPVDLLKLDPSCSTRKMVKLDSSCQPTDTDILSKVMNDMNKDFKQQTATHNLKPLRKEQRSVAKTCGDGGSNLKLEKTDDDFADCPKSPDIVEVPDHNPIIIPSQKPVRMNPSRVKYLFNKLLIYSKEEKMFDKIVSEFATQDQYYIAEIVIQKLSLDYRDKVDNLYPPAPAMTHTQRVLLGFMVRLQRTNHPNMLDAFLHAAEMELFDRRLCKLTVVSPITRVYAAICKWRRDLNRLRRFCCEGFYFMGDFAVPMLFTVLTVWSEVLPPASQSSDFPIVKVLVQLCMLKGCNLPGYNLSPLKDLLHKFYGYPSERWKCDDVFQEVLIEYLRNPSERLADCALLLFLKNKPTKWVYRKMKENIMPLLETIPLENKNLRATFIIMLGNVCNAFDKYDEHDWSVIQEMEQWFRNLDSDDLDPLSKRSIYLAMSRLPRRPNRGRPAKQKQVKEVAAANANP